MQLAQLAETRGRLPHALLVHGREGVGQFELAMAFAQFLQCEQPAPGGQACGNCSACTWFSQGNHPDFRLLQPESMADDEDAETAAESKKKSDQIRIEQVRDLQRFLAVGSHRGGPRVIVLHPADAMNMSTQNAVLKSLEEPPPDTLFLAVTSFPHRLLPTIRSRCQDIAVPIPGRDQAARWLEQQGIENPESLLALAGGAPLSAMRLSESEPVRRRLITQLSEPRFDPVAVTEHCLGAEPGEVVAWLQRWVYDLLSLKLTGRIRYHLAEEQGLGATAARCDPARAATLLRKLAKARSLAQHPLNPRLFFEDILIQYHDLIAGGGR
ncbi:MAG TPA: DNA polymerase III subunit delta', partial [Candidatus Glassbacteria bacterium]|nr:DNA polymerase III subunit delta' [Candidatus Glassbacteria bacterium]